jgi:transketolase
VSIEAGTTLGWERFTGHDGLNFGIDSFGASAPAPDLYKHFGLTPDAIAPKILAALNTSKEQA